MINNRFREMFYAGVWGDVLGSVYEFKEAEEIPKDLTIDQILGNKENVFGYKVGTYTDDTILMLCAMSSFIETKKFDPDNQMTWLGKYVNDGIFTPDKRCFDIGNATLASYLEWSNGKQGDKYHRCGNGVLMKLAPFSFWWSEHNDELATMTKLTHSSLCVFTAQEMFAMQRKMLKGYEVFPDLTLKHEKPTGFHSCSWAIANKSQDHSLNQTILNAISYGGDADTNACIAAQIHQHPAMSDIRFSSIYNFSQIEDIVEQFIEVKNANT